MLLIVCAGILCLSGSAFAQATSITSTGFRATEGGGGALTTVYTTGNLGNTWSEGEWVPYQLIIENVQTDYPGLVGFPNIVMSYDFTGGGDKRFVDLVRSIQAGTSGLSDLQGWPRDDGSPYPMTTRAEIEEAQNDIGNTGDLENIWPGFANLNLPDSQMNRFRVDDTTFTDGSPTDAEHTFYITLQDLLDAGIPTDADSIIIYYQLHESRTFVWLNSLQEQYDQAQTDGWGGYLYSEPAYAADARLASGYVPGSSGHIEVEFASGAKTVPIPIPEQLPGEVSGLKWLDNNGDGIMDMGEPTLSGWRIYVSGELEGISFSDTTETDGSGFYSFPNLTSGTVWHIREDAQRYSPSELGYQQTYPSNGTLLGVGTGFDWGPSAPLADVGWDVALTADVSSQGDMNFGNKLCTPSLICPPNVIIGCTESIDPANTGSPTVDVNCPDYTLNYTDSETPGACPQELTIERTWIVVDAAGMADTCVQTITVEDNTAPVLSATPADASYECTAPAPPTITALDDCDEDVPVIFTENISGSCPATITRTWTATDDCGNSVSHTQTITVYDNTDPVLSGVPGDVTIECSDPYPDTAAVSATDNCDPNPTLTVVDVLTPGNCADAYTITRTWTATDTCGNSVSASQVITVVDTTPPTLSDRPADVTVNCTAPDAPTITATDNCDDDVPVIFTENVSGSCPATITRTWSATDDCGNSVSYTQTITVIDTTDPELAGVPDDFTMQCSDPYPDTAVVTASDNCDPNPSLQFSEVITPGSCPDAYTITRTWTATDSCGNSVSDSQVITVVDTEAPVLSDRPADATYECTAPAAPTITATDNCDDDVPVTFTESASGSCPTIITRTWSAADDCGNSVSYTQTVTVIDTTKPELAGVPGDATLECSDPYPDTAAVTASDNCDPNPTLTVADVITPGACADAYTITRTWTATDSCGNSISASQVFTIVDTTPPVLSATPGDVRVNCAAPDPAIITATDNCDDDVPVIFSESSSGTCPQVITRTWTATDDCGNSVSHTQTVTVVDEEAPVLSDTPADATVNCAAPDAPTITATDNCDPSVTVNFTENSSGTCPTVITRTWSATDACGNSTSHTQTITVIDEEAPVLSDQPADATYECAAPDAPTITATDNCDPSVTVNYSESASGSCPTTILRTWSAADACGNSVSYTQTITVIDTTNPVLAGVPDDQTLECDVPYPDTANVTATDNCDPNPVVAVVDVVTPGSCPDAYTITRTWTATDSCGNSVSDSQVFTIVDTTPPVLSDTPGDVTVDCVAPDAPTITATDNCDDDVPVIFSETSTGSCPTTVTRTWTATDDCGNSVSHTQVITVQDIEAPVLSAMPADASYDCSAPDAPTITATDNCDGSVPVNFTENRSGSCPLIITRTWSASDRCGNTVSHTQTVTVDDTEAPVLTCAPDDSVECEGTVIFTPPTVTDNCDPAPVVTEVSTDVVSGPGDGEFTHTRTWEATDSCGNVSFQCSQSIIVLACPDEYCTYTMGGWGSECPESQAGDMSSTQPGCMRDHYFADVFPAGVTIGHPSGYQATWTSSAAVAAYLPAGETPGVLTADLTNPITTPAGVLAGQVLALTLNREYSCAGVFADLNLGDGTVACLGSFVIPDSCGSKFAGLTVDEFLDIANKAVAGKTNVLNGYGATLSDVNYTADCLNNRFNDCDPYVYAAVLAYSDAAPLRGDVNLDGEVTVTDAIALINIVLRGGEGLSPACDVNRDCYGTTADIITLVNIVLKGESASSGE